MSESSHGREIPAGFFSEWLEQTRSGMRDGRGAEVPCGDCRACCTSSYFIHIESDETEALTLVGDESLPAPGRPGHRVMGFDSEGVCPKMKTTGCSIYENRPRTCRIYDCRVFAAAGLDAGPGKPRINERIFRWRFQYRDGADRERHEAVKSAAAFIRDHAALFPGRRIPTDPGQLALLALKVHEELLGAHKDLSDSELVARIVKRAQTFELTTIREPERPF